MLAEIPIQQRLSLPRATRSTATHPDILVTIPAGRRPVFVVDAVRTPIGRYAGALATVRPDDLLALTLQGPNQAVFFSHPWRWLASSRPRNVDGSRDDGRPI